MTLPAVEPKASPPLPVLDQYARDINSYFDRLPPAAFERASCLFCSPHRPSRVWFKKSTQEIRACECGFVFNAHQPSSASLGAFYAQSAAMDSWAAHKRSARERVRAEAKYGRVTGHLKTAGIRSILDVGCGNGEFLRLLKQALPGVTELGIDPNKAALSDASKAGVNVKQIDIFDFKPNGQLSCFDAISLWGVIEHVKDPFGLLHALSYYLNPNGYLVVCVPNVASLVTQTLQAACFTFCPQHLWHFNRDRLSKLLGWSGFKETVSWTIEPETLPVLKIRNGHEPYAALEPWELEYCDLTRCASPSEVLRLDQGYKWVMIARKHT